MEDNRQIAPSFSQNMFKKKQKRKHTDFVFEVFLMCLESEADITFKNIKRVELG